MYIPPRKIDTTFSIQNIRKTCRIRSTIDLLSENMLFLQIKMYVFRFNIPNKTKEHTWFSRKSKRDEDISNSS